MRSSRLTVLNRPIILRRALAALVQGKFWALGVGKVLRQKTRINFGGEGLPLSELSNVASLTSGADAVCGARNP
jgi:hypothetical protein